MQFPLFLASGLYMGLEGFRGIVVVDGMAIEVGSRAVMPFIQT